MSASLCCASDSARRAGARKSALNGIDYVEVDCAQTTLSVYFLGRAPDWIEAANVRIEGGRRERGIVVRDIRVERAEDDGLDDVMHVSVDRPGDFSTYRLCVVALDDKGKPTGRPPADFDPRYACLDFSFKAGCPSDLDCATPPDCPEPIFDEPAIDYLAKDYGSFRQLILDRLALTLPDWRERHAPDVMLTLVELLAYAGDHLSYHQDAVAAEAYLDTARLRISVQRHARLVGYRLHEGCNARTWLAFDVSEPELRIAAADVFFVTDGPGANRATLKEAELEPAPAGGTAVFEPLLPSGADGFTLRKVHNAIPFYAWGEDECCLAAGATAATLLDPGEAPRPRRRGKRAAQEAPEREDDFEAGVSDGRWHELRLAPGDVLLFEERIGPRTGDPADADPDHRHAVRLTRVTPSWDPLTRKLVCEIEWCAEDALPFPLCLSSRTDAPDCRNLTGVSVALGNVILADEGETHRDEALPPVEVRLTEARCADDCGGAERSELPARFRPRLARADLVFASAYDSALPRAGGCRGAAATAALDQVPHLCTAAVALASDDPLTGAERHWRARNDLLGSDAEDFHFVAEIDDRRVAWLRFGDGSCGRGPDAREEMKATYRTGGGPAGNLGRDSISRIVFRNAFPDGVKLGVRNPLPARGGTAPEPVARARLRAPHLFRTRLERAVAPDDYAAIVIRDFPGEVQRAGAMLRSTGAAAEIQLAIDSFGSTDPDPDLLRRIERHLEGYRRIGHDVRAIKAEAVPLVLELTVCVQTHMLRGHVKAALLRVLGAGRWSGGRGFFHPDSLALGDPIRTSQIVAAAHRVEGVASVIVTRLERLWEGPQGEVAAGELILRPEEVARLDNDPAFPENGALILNMRDGR